MADTVTTQILQDGPQTVVMKFTNISDGTGESAVTKVDVSALSGAPSSVRIMRVHFTTVGIGVDLRWDATADVAALSLPPDQCGVLDFTVFGGISNDAGSGVTGDIKFTTVPTGVSGTAKDRYTVILEMRKS